MAAVEHVELVPHGVSKVDCSSFLKDGGLLQFVFVPSPITTVLLQMRGPFVGMLRKNTVYRGLRAQH